MLQTNRDSLKINSTPKIEISNSNNIENISEISNNNFEDEKIKISSTSPIYIFCRSLKEMNSQNETGWTPIYRSVLANNIQALKELLELGGDPNICNSLGETPIYLSIENQNYEALKILLEHNADPNIKKRNGNTPLHMAIKKKLENKYIISLLNSKADPNILNKFYNQTPTHLALINKCDEEILKTLKENKADIYGIKDKYDKTPFDYVQETNDTDYMNKVINIFGKKEETKNDNNSQIKNKTEKNGDKAIDLKAISINTIKIDLSDNDINIIKGKNNKKESNEITFNYLKLNLPKQQTINSISFGNKNSYEIKDDDISIKMNTNKSKDKIEQESKKENMNININKSKPLTMDIPENNYLLNSLNNIGILSKKNNKTESKNIISFPEYLKTENDNENIIGKIGLVNNYINNNDFNSIANKNNKSNSNDKNINTNTNNAFNSNINSSSLCYSLSKETQTQKLKEAESEIEIKNKMFSNSSETDKEIIKTIISATAKRINNSKDKNLSNTLSNKGSKNSNSNNSNQTSKIININKNGEINAFSTDNISDEILNILDEEDKKKEREEKKEKEKEKNIEEDKTSPFLINTKTKEENQNVINNNIENNQFKAEDDNIKNELNIKKLNNLNINTNEINNDNKNENKDNNNLVSLTKDGNIFNELQMNTTDANLNKTKKEMLKDKDNGNEIGNDKLYNISKNNTNENIINIKQANNVQKKGTLTDDKNIDINFSISDYKENVIIPIKAKDKNLLKKDFDVHEEQNKSQKENKNENEQKNKSNNNHLNHKIIEISSHKKVGINKEKDYKNNFNNKTRNNQTNNVHRLSYHNNNNNKRNKNELGKDNLINIKNEDEMSNMTDKTNKTNKTNKSNKSYKTINIVTDQKNNISSIYNKENENPNSANSVIVYQSKNFMARTTNKNKITKNSNSILSKNYRQKVYYGESKSIERKDKILYNKQKVFRHSSPDYNYNYKKHFNRDNLISENSFKKNNNSFISALNTNRSNESNNNIYIYDNTNNNAIDKRIKYNNYTNQYPLYNPYDDSIEGSVTNRTNHIMYRNKNNLTKNKFAFNMNSFNNTTYSSYHNNVCKIRNKNYLEPLMNRNSVTNNSFSNNSNCYSYRNNSGSSSYRNSNNQNILISDKNNNIYITKNNNNSYRLSIKPHRTIANSILIRLRDWLISCDLLCYYNILIKNNMYDIDRYINDIRNNKINLSYKDIEELGIKKPGHIFRLLLKLEVDAGKIDNNLYNYIIEKFNINTVTNNGILTSSISDIKCCGLNCCSTNNNYNYSNRRIINNNSNIFSDNYYSNNYGDNTNETENDYCEDIVYVDIFSFLKKKNLWRFKENFIHNGFDQIEYVLIQLFSKYSFDKNILNDYMHIYLDDEKNYVLKKLYSEKKKISKILGFQYNEAELKQILLSQSSSADNYNNYMSSVVGTNSNIHNNDSCCSIF